MNTIMLPIISALLISMVREAGAAPYRQKIPVHLDFLGNISPMIMVTQSTEFPRAINYFITRNYEANHVIGDVKYGPEVISPEYTRNIARYLLLVIRHDGSRYLKINNIIRLHTGRLYRYIEEFVKAPSVDSTYMKLNRVPLDFNILTSEKDCLLNVQLVQGVPTFTGNLPENFEKLPLKFTVPRELQDKIVIGRVTFGKHVIDYGENGIIDREVVWEGGICSPLITVTTRYSDGSEVEAKYKFGKETNMFYDYYTDRKSLDIVLR